MKLTRRLVKIGYGAWTNAEKWSYCSGLRSPRGLPLPHFLGIGAQKCGTTWLDKNLRRHPDLFLPKKKEVHYFDRAYHRSLRFYLSKFKGGEDKIRGEITPAYSGLAVERIRYIRSIMPEARLIFLMRDPIARAWSHSVMHLLKRTGRSFDEVPEEEFRAHFRGRDSRRKGDYLGALDNWLSVFPEEQLFIGYYDDISTRPQELLRDVMAHIGVTDDIDWDQMPFREFFHKGLSVSLPDPLRADLEELYAPDLERLRARFGDRVTSWGRRKTAAGAR